MRLEDVAILVRLRLEQAQTAIHDGEVLLREEGSPQSVINRAYYAMFYATLALLQTIGKAPTKHTGVIGLFDTEFMLKGAFPKQLSKDFHKVFDSRNVSDYKPAQFPAREEAEDCLGKAKGFVACVEQYLKEKYLST